MFGLNRIFPYWYVTTATINRNGYISSIDMNAATIPFLTDPFSPIP